MLKPWQNLRVEIKTTLLRFIYNKIPGNKRQDMYYGHVSKHWRKCEKMKTRGITSYHVKDVKIERKYKRIISEHYKTN
jgi:hypothetical protein